MTFFFNDRNIAFKKIHNSIIHHIFFFSLALVPIIGIEEGAKRWLDLYFFRLQPIELLKPFLFW